MDRIKPDFKCRLDELVPLARLLRASYLRDQADFQELLPEDYTAAFLKDYDAHVAAADALEATSVQIAKRMVFTERIEAVYKGLPQALDFLAARVRRATPLTVPADRFGIEQARRARNHDDHSGLEASLKTLLQNLEANKAALAAKGQKPDDTQKLQDLYEALVADTTSQGSQMSSQKINTEENMTVLNALYAEMAHLFNDGKALYARSDKAKAEDYTFQQLLKRVRRERKAGTAQ
ncbi:hypothetical protein KBK19_12775 [Microvirga sp. STR05]|uniref:Uncharacterized protein n=1 Tax=Hymenobacter duratus TaxID=2771356 RepID=A0ABR8JJY1_9BACT|nr:hypothetical protein [Hymenobacter duratus]MBD2715908.1 hypothetical protein [Hymenobacter duratus]MBR7950822.1 hypothetical protein [Microvirga sp. STR05]